MHGRKTSIGALDTKKLAPRLSELALLAHPVPRATRPAPAERLLWSKYRQLTRKHLGRLLKKPFADFTGLHFLIAWAPAISGDWDARKLPTACSVCCRMAGTNLAAQPACRTCGPRQLVRALTKVRDGHRFNCRLGVQNYWLPVRVRDLTIGIAYLQALDHRQARKPTRLRSAHSATRVLSRSKFNRASRLLRLIVQHVQTLDVAALRLEDLAEAQQALRVFERVQARWRRELNHVMPAFRKTPPVAESGNHAERILRLLMERIHRDYARPLTLRDCAQALNLNAAYLSALFSRAMGLPFKTYLTEVRMEKARELLSDPVQAVSDVASAVGYATENRFRLAFRNVTGLSPKLWRETLRMPSR
jgi:AraC-like DNA-binding protein